MQKKGTLISRMEATSHKQNRRVKFAKSAFDLCNEISDRKEIPTINYK